MSDLIDDGDELDNDLDGEATPTMNLGAGVTLDRPAFPSAAPPEGEVTVLLEIENTYELYDGVTTYAVVTVPAPPAVSDATYDDWKYDNFHEHTGVGYPDGDSWYDVIVLASSHPDLIAVGQEWDFGY